MDINKILLEIIEKKFNELQKFQKEGIFEKIRTFEGNAIGQIGEIFVKEIFKNLNIKMKDFGEIIHDEFDICLDDGTKIEIKTARKGLKKDTFQFNGINPNYNAKFIICIGICLDSAYFKIVNGEKIYDHKSRSFSLNLGDKIKKIIPMNPGNQANYKLTLNLNELEPIENFADKIAEICKNLKAKNETK